MERAATVFIWLAVAAGFLYGLIFTESRVVPALGAAVIFGVASIMITGLVAVLAHLMQRALGRH